MARIDQRANDELRPVRFKPNFSDYAEGSILIETGKTCVLCNVSVEDKVPDWRMDSGAGWLTAEYGMLPRATHRRMPRSRGSESARSQEIRRLIGRALRASVDLHKLGPRTLTIDCDVLQADGGTRTASVTGAYVAVVMALRKLINANIVPPEVLVTPVAAVSVGLVDNDLLLDLCYEEDAAAQVDLNVVMTGSGQFVEIQGTAEGAPFDQAALLGMIELGQQGIQQLLAKQQALLNNATNGKK
jgi:ribonuclease PH